MKCIAFMEMKMYLYAICYVIFTFFFNNRIVETWYRNVKANMKVSFFRPFPIRESRKGKNVTWEPKLFGTLDTSRCRDWILLPLNCSLNPSLFYRHDCFYIMLPFPCYRVSFRQHKFILRLPFCYVYIQWNDICKNTYNIVSTSIK